MCVWREREGEGERERERRREREIEGERRETWPSVWHTLMTREMREGERPRIDREERDMRGNGEKEREMSLLRCRTT